MAARVKRSVGIPAHNLGEYRAQTLKSLLAQPEPPDEVVVSDRAMRPY